MDQATTPVDEHWEGAVGQLVESAIEDWWQTTDLWEVDMEDQATIEEEPQEAPWEGEEMDPATKEDELAGDVGGGEPEVPGPSTPPSVKLGLSKALQSAPWRSNCSKPKRARAKPAKRNWASRGSRLCNWCGAFAYFAKGKCLNPSCPGP